MRRSLHAVACASSLAGFSTIASAGDAQSILDRLPDYSQAGTVIPTDQPITARARDFGALPDDDHDDTAALRQALATMPPGVLLLDPGVYHLSDRLLIHRSGIVLRGSGTDSTILHFTRSLEDIEPKPTTNTGGRPVSAYSWSGGLIEIHGTRLERGPRIGPLIPTDQPTIFLAPDIDTSTLKPGQRVVMLLRDDDARSLTQTLNGQTLNDTGKFNPPTVAQPTVIKSIDGQRIEIQPPPIPLSALAAWKPLLTEDRTLRDSGVEDLTIRFPVTSYEGHFTERGWNGISMVGTSACWVRNVNIDNPDSGIFVGAGHRNTLANIRFRSERPDTLSDTGHHGITLSGVLNLASDCRFDTRFIHDLTITAGSYMNVFERIVAKDLSIDPHKRAPSFNLFADIDAGAGTRLYRHGGGDELGRPCGIGNVLWNIRAERDPGLPPDHWAPADLVLVHVSNESTDRWPLAIPKDAPLPTPNPRKPSR